MARTDNQITEDGQPRSIYRHVNSGGSFGCSPLRQTIGLGKARRIERLEIFWPTTGRTQVLTDVPVNQAVRIVEGTAGFEPLPQRAFKLGGPSSASVPPLLSPR